MGAHISEQPMRYKTKEGRSEQSLNTVGFEEMETIEWIPDKYILNMLTTEV